MIPIKIYLTEKERDALKDLAAKNNLSLSAFVKKLIEDIWEEDDPVIFDEKQQTARDKYIQIRVTAEEYAQIKRLAGTGSLSNYARKALLSGGHPVNISIVTDDITDFDFELSDKLQHFQNAIEALAYRSTLQPQEAEKLLSILTEIRDDMKEMNHYIKNNRQSIRNAGLRWLKQKYIKEKRNL